jgi:hypothetical protein
MILPSTTKPGHEMKNYREYVANVGAGKTGTQAVTVKATTPQEAFTKLQRMGYKRISNIAAI